MQKLPFVVAGGSVPGTDHTKPGQPGWTNNQDAYAWQETPNALVAVVCDGCGTTKRSEVGSQLAAAFITKSLATFVSDLPIEQALNLLVPRLNSFIETTARALGSDLAKAVGEYFLFTVVGVIVTPERTMVFEAGDGVYAINGDVKIIGPYPGNAPPYLGHRFTNGDYDNDLLGIRIHKNVPTNEVDSILIGTDGVSDFMSSAERRLPNQRQNDPSVLGPISQFWENDLFIKNPDTIRRRLALANCDSVEGEGDKKRIKRGLLPDDTTLVVIRREEVATP